jgi:hypothetical protein
MLQVTQAGCRQDLRHRRMSICLRCLLRMGKTNKHQPSVCFGPWQAEAQLFGWTLYARIASARQGPVSCYSLSPGTLPVL